MILISLSLICMVGYVSPSLINRLHVLQRFALHMNMITRVFVAMEPKQLQKQSIESTLKQIFPHCEISCSRYLFSG